MKMAAAVNSCKILGFHIQTKTPIASSSSSLSFSLFFKSSLCPVKLPRLRINKKQAQCFWAPRISCLSEDDRKELKESEHLSFSENSQQPPRRNLLVTFTCGACGAQSQRLINRLAYERGLVYVQCLGCSQYHKLVDNLGLVVEYKLQDEIDSDANTDYS